MLSPLSASACRDELQKIAATRQVKILRQLAKEKRWDELNAMVKQLSDADVLKVSPQGTDVARLGTGGEGIADLVVGAGGQKLTRKEPVTVRKTYDTLGPMYSKEQLAEKVNFLRRMRQRKGKGPAGGAGDFAELYGGIRKTPKGGRYTLHEFVPEITGPANLPDESVVSHALRNPDRTMAHLKKKGLPVVDPQSVREMKQAPLIEEFVRRGVPEEEAVQRVERMIPARGNPEAFDLHGENLVQVPSGYVKALDFSVVPSHRLEDINFMRKKLDRELYRKFDRMRAGIPEGADRSQFPGPPPLSEEMLDAVRRRQAAQAWRDELGANTPPSATGWMGRGIIGGPKAEGAETAVLKSLGGGKAKQAPKQRGHYEPPAPKPEMPEAQAPPPPRKPLSYAPFIAGGAGLAAVGGGGTAAIMAARRRKMMQEQQQAV